VSADLVLGTPFRAAELLNRCASWWCSRINKGLLMVAVDRYRPYSTHHDVQPELWCGWAAKLSCRASDTFFLITFFTVTSRGALAYGTVESLYLIQLVEPVRWR